MQNSKEKSHTKISPFRILIIVCCGLLIGLCVYMINAVSFSGGSSPMPFGVSVGVVLSGSMEPELSVDDVIIVRRSGEYRVGDVVVYSRTGRPVVHRIIKMDGSTVVTQGDANNAADEPISPSDITGKVVAHIPKAGVVVGFLQSPVGVLIVLGAALLLLELSFRREKEDGDRELEEIKSEIRRLKESCDRSAADNEKENDNNSLEQ